MTLNRISLLALVAATLMVAGCGDDDPTPPMPEAGTPMACHDSTTMLDLTVTEACQNADDMANTPDNYSDVTASCARGCFLSGNRSPDCVVACIRNMTECVVSTNCTTCYAISSGCAADNCLTECLSPETEEACLACRCGANAAGVNCFDAFTACAGGEPSTSCEGVMIGDAGMGDASMGDAGVGDAGAEDAAAGDATVADAAM